MDDKCRVPQLIRLSHKLPTPSKFLFLKNLSYPTSLSFVVYASPNSHISTVYLTPNEWASAAMPTAVHGIGYARPHASAGMSLPKLQIVCLASSPRRGGCDGSRVPSHVGSMSCAGLRDDCGQRDGHVARSEFNVDQATLIVVLSEKDVACSLFNVAAPTLNSAPSLKDVACSKINIAPSHASFPGRNSSFRRQHSSFTPQQKALGGEYSMCMPQH